jgi:hypothetical protein
MRKKRGQPTKPIYVRCDPALYEQIDRLRKETADAEGCYISMNEMAGRLLRLAVLAGVSGGGRRRR